MTDSLKSRHAQVRSYIQSPAVDVEMDDLWDDDPTPVTESHFKTQIYTKEELAFVRAQACTTPAELNAIISKRRAQQRTTPATRKIAFKETTGVRRRPIKGYSHGFWHGGVIVLVGFALGCVVAIVIAHLP